MTQDEKRDVALMRYSAIAPLVTGTATDFKSNHAFFKEAATKTYITPSGMEKKFSPDTIEGWYKNYRASGFDGLMPAGRSDHGHSRALTPEAKEVIIYLKNNYPRMPATAIYKHLIAKGVVCEREVSESTVNRYINRLMVERKLTNNHDMRRYERPHINEVWCGDSSVGPRLYTPNGKQRVYIIALIDDASRFVVGADVFFNDKFVNLLGVIKSAVSRYGRPKVFNFDNGASYKNKQMELLAARIGSSINYCHPYTPTAKAKIERWFRTLKDHWMATLDMREIDSLGDLRDSLNRFIDEYNNSPHSSLNGKTPSDRFFSEPDQIHRLSQEEIDKSFLLELDRTVSSDSVISIDSVEYEVDYRFAKQRIRLRYSPDLKDIYVIEADGSFTPIKLLNKTENSLIRRDKVHLCRGE